MKYLKEYYNYDNDVSKKCLQYSIKNWSIREGLVDVDGGVYLTGMYLNELPLRFGRIGGYFWCDNNQLTTLESAPKWISRDFGCGYNKLNTLEGAPKSVNGYFNCSYNQLTTLEHFPNVKGIINISENSLPKEIYDNVEHLKQIIEMQDDYDIWRDGKLYLPRFKQLILDIKEDKK